MQLSDDEKIREEQVKRLTGLFNSEYPEAHSVAALGISMIGEQAVPYVLEGLPYRKGRRGASPFDAIEWALSTIGKAAIPHYKKTVESDNAFAAEFAAKMLRDMGEIESTVIASQLAKAQSELFAKVEEKPGMSRGNLQRQFQEMMPLQTQLLYALGDVGDEIAIDALMKSIDVYRDKRVRREGTLGRLIEITHDALSEIGEPAIPRLIEYMKLYEESEDQDVLKQRRGDLIRLGKSSNKMARDYLVGLLREDADERLVGDVITAIRKGEDPIPTLIGLISGENQLAQQKAAEAVASIKKSA